jgi:HSP20 family molecular chaperone IbpA
MNSWNAWLPSASPCDEIPADSHRSQHDRFTPFFFIHETPDGYEIESELTRSTRADISVKPHRHYVEICCGRAVDHEEADREEPERVPRFGSFVTQLPLRTAIDVAHTNATFRDGLLRIHAPKWHS